jgi:4a-hydroxytetrahydrobiopterin dehydratase
MAELLDDDRIAAALTALPGWTREQDQLVRRVPVADSDAENLERAVGTVADELNHHPETERTPGELCFRLSTHSAGGITAKDVDLAARIDQVISGPALD